MKIAYYGYREWSLNVFKKITLNDKYLITNLDYEILYSIKPDLVFFVGWSNIIPKNIINDFKCICLHPSKLPKYRGGSPIQNQIMNNEKNSAVTLFIMDHGIDSGDILFQEEFKLDGNLQSIFDNIENIGIKGINFIIENYKKINEIRVKQNESDVSFFKRLKPSNSEITIEDIINNEPIVLHNKIRSLNDPYPNAYIKCKNGKKLYLIESKYEQ